MLSYMCQKSVRYLSCWDYHACGFLVKQAQHVLVRSLTERNYSLPSNKDRPHNFSESSSHPSKYKLDETVGIPEGITYQEKSGLKPTISRVITFGVMLLAGYAFFFSDYNLEVEEAMFKDDPTYEDKMMENPAYAKRIEELRSQRTKEKLRSFQEKDFNTKI